MKLGKLCKTQYGTSAATTSDGEQHVLGMSNIGDGRVDLAGLSRASLPEREASTLRLRKYDVLFNRTNSRALVGKVGILMEEPETPTVFASYLVRLIPNERVRPQWLAYAMSSGITGRSIVRLITLGVSQANINPSELLKWVAIPVPPIEVQDHLLGRFSDFDNAADKLRDQIAVAKHRRRGLMQQLLTGRRRLPAFAGDAWEEDHLGDLFAERAETGRTDLPLLSITAERGVIPREEIERKDTSNADKSKYKRIAPGDIGYNTMRMWQGVSALSSLEGIVSPAYTICIPGPKIDGRFARWFFKFPPVVNLFYRYSQGLVDDTLNLKYPHFAEIKVRVPTSLDEQRAIADILDTAQREIELLEQLREQIQLQKRGLMQKLLTGEIRVPGDEPVTEEVS